MTTRTRVTFLLPLASHRATNYFTPESLRSLAAMLPGQPVQPCVDSQGGLQNIAVGRVVSAVVEGESIRCEAEVDVDYESLFAGYGLDAAGKREDGRFVSINRARVAGIPPHLLPKDARV